VSADIYLKRNGHEARIIGRSSAVTEEDGYFGRDDDLHATASVIVMERMGKFDQVFVSMMSDNNRGSYLKSDVSRKIHFTGVKISD